MFGYFNALNTSSQGKEILNNLFSTHFIKARKLLKNKNDKLFDFHSLAYTITSPFAVNDLHLVTLNTHLNATKFILCLELFPQKYSLKITAKYVLRLPLCQNFCCISPLIFRPKVGGAYQTTVDYIQQNMVQSISPMEGA